MKRLQKACVLGALTAGMALVPAASAWAIQNPTTGQPGTTAGFNCTDPGATAEPGNAANAPGSAFNESGSGIAGAVYAGSTGTASLTHAQSMAAVSQYDTACRRLSSP